MRRTNEQALLAQLAHGDLKSGEFVIKFGDAWFVGNIQEITVECSVDSLTQVRLEGIVYN